MLQNSNFKTSRYRQGYKVMLPQERYQYLRAYERHALRLGRWILPDKMNPFHAMTEDEFVARFRLSKESTNVLIQKILHMLPVSLDGRGCSVPPHLQVLITLSYVATGSHQLSIADCCEVSQAFVSICVSRVARVIAHLSSEYIHFPPYMRRIYVMQEFMHIAGIPGVLGCIDCTHIAIQRPSSPRAEVFCCREGYFSINVQAVCGPQLKFFNIVARWPGSVHGSRIFDKSHICQELEDGKLDGHLLGDNGYPCRKYLLTPIIDPNNIHEQSYNVAHIKTHKTIERAFSVLKRRFSCLGKKLRTSLETTKVIIVACAILHNLAIQYRVAEPEIYVDDSNENPVDLMIHHPDPPNTQRNIEGNVRRQEIINQYF
ncbi:putative nuclease HARBI1 [Penaeus monodon]|uniref:putative nuclease HARBI1 n=1 Tax=Penaeus monodon TaxID=6687 RepID=UPI0018A78592|nr:putative nuclease HARBI1 [Penaeus monodon]